MAQDIFMKIEGIAGESRDFKHAGEIEVLAWDWRILQPSNMHAGHGGGVEKATVYDLNFEHYFDKSIPSLLQYCLTGKHIPSAVLTIRRAGGKPLESIRIKLEDILIANVLTVGNSTLRLPREKISLSFSRIRFDYIVQGAAGIAAGTISGGVTLRLIELFSRK